jgi:hypothetical protein
MSYRSITTAAPFNAATNYETSDKTTRDSGMLIHAASCHVYVYTPLHRIASNSMAVGAQAL